jgi:hypothetical protein
MARMYFILFIASAVVTLGSGMATPAQAQKCWTSADCKEKCRKYWGYRGDMYVDSCILRIEACDARYPATCTRTKTKRKDS